MLVKLDGPDVLPVSVERAKKHLRETASEVDDYIRFLIETAVSTVEDHTGRVLRRSLWERRLDAWPGAEPIRLAAFPIRDVGEVVYLDEAGDEQVVADGDWYWLPTDDGAEVRFASGFSAPALFDRPQSIRVRFEAGYDAPEESGSGDDPELEIDPKAEMAVLFLVGHWYSVRESVNVGNIVQEIPQTFVYLANQLRIFR